MKQAVCLRSNAQRRPSDEDSRVGDLRREIGKGGEVTQERVGNQARVCPQTKSCRD